MRSEYQRMKLFERICMVYGQEFQRFIYGLTRNDPFAAEEIYQNTMLGALKGLDYLRDSRKMKAWIFAIAKAESRRYYASKQAAGLYEYGNIIQGQFGIEPVFDFTKSIEDIEYIKSLVNSLSDEEHQLFILHYFYGVPLKEISEILNLNYNTIRSMHTRGMAKMRKMHTEREAMYG